MVIFDINADNANRANQIRDRAKNCEVVRATKCPIPGSLVWSAFTALSFGGAPIGNFNGAFTEDEAQHMVSQAWDQGIRYFDTAPGYGNGLSEHRLGLALRQRDRKDYVLSTKVGRVLTPRLDAPSTNGQYLDIPPLVADYDYSYDGVMRAVEQSMQRMLTDRFDALFIHDCDVYTHGSAAAEYFRHRQRLPGAGIMRSKTVKAIGFGINETDLMIDAIKATDADLCLLAGRYTLLERSRSTSCSHFAGARRQDRVGQRLQQRGAGHGPVPGARFSYAPADADILAKAAAFEESAVTTWHCRRCPAVRLRTPRRQRLHRGAQRKATSPQRHTVRIQRAGRTVGRPTRGQHDPTRRPNPTRMTRPPIPSSTTRSWRNPHRRVRPWQRTCPAWHGGPISAAVALP
jgi:D-threo-aldose 1-dehydrogenase